MGHATPPLPEPLRKLAALAAAASFAVGLTACSGLYSGIDYPGDLPNPGPELITPQNLPDPVIDFNRAKIAPKAFGALAEGGLLWMAYPKKSSGIPSDLTRDEGWAAVTGAGWRTVSLVAIDDAWSAARLRPVT